MSGVLNGLIGSLKSGGDAEILLTSSAVGSFYQATSTISSGTYTITPTAAGENGGAIFWNGATQIAAAQFNGTTPVTVSVPSAATRVAITTNASGNLKIAGPCTPATLTSYTPTAEVLTSGTSYTKTGPARFIVVGGGGGGAGNALNSRLNGGGGGSGGITSGFQYISVSAAYTIGAAGGSGWNNPGAAGGATTFGSTTANGGGGGRNRWDAPSANQPISGLAGTPGGGGYSNANGSILTPSSATPIAGVPNAGATTGPGRNFVTGAGTGSVLGGGGGSGIGTGGSTANSYSLPTGYGAGGSGPTNLGGSQPWGTAGTQGVVYVVRPV